MLLQNEDWSCIVSLFAYYSFHILAGHCDYFSLVFSRWSLWPIFLWTYLVIWILHVFSIGSRRYVSSSKSFLFSLYNINGYAPVKVNIKSSHYSSAIYTWSGYGPTFGAGHDLHISGNAGNNSYPYTSCGSTYPLPPGYSSYHSSCQFYAGSYHFTPTDVEVFNEITT